MSHLTHLFGRSRSIDSCLIWHISSIEWCAHLSNRSLFIHTYVAFHLHVVQHHVYIYMKRDLFKRFHIYIRCVSPTRCSPPYNHLHHTKLSKSDTNLFLYMCFFLYIWDVSNEKHKCDISTIPSWVCQTQICASLCHTLRLSVSHTVPHCVRHCASLCHTFSYLCFWFDTSLRQISFHILKRKISFLALSCIYVSFHICVSHLTFDTSLRQVPLDLYILCVSPICSPPHKAEYVTHKSLASYFHVYTSLFIYLCLIWHVSVAGFNSFIQTSRFIHTDVTFHLYVLHQSSGLFDMSLFT